MRRLILMRHAKSDWNHPGLGDHDRPLNARGIASATALGDWLRAKDYIPDAVLCSSAERTGQTLLGLALPDGVPTTFTRTLYLAEAPQMLEQLRTAEGQVSWRIGLSIHRRHTSASRTIRQVPHWSAILMWKTGTTSAGTKASRLIS